MITLLVGWFAPFALRLLRGRVAPDRADAIVGSKAFAAGVLALVGLLAIGASVLGVLAYGAWRASEATEQCVSAIRVKALEKQLEAQTADKALAERRLADRTKALEGIEKDNAALGAQLKELRDAKSRDDADPFVVRGDDVWLQERARRAGHRPGPR